MAGGGHKELGAGRSVAANHSFANPSDSLNSHWGARIIVSCAEGPNVSPATGVATDFGLSVSLALRSLVGSLPMYASAAPKRTSITNASHHPLTRRDHGCPLWLSPNTSFAAERTRGWLTLPRFWP